MQKQVDFQSVRAHFRYLLLKMWKTNAQRAPNAKKRPRRI